ncbi:hypothetical protein M5D96_013372 [Drosophila gunungcola]|uniref:Uncharacterized protein n=1 Tax=Drosophila gunungcola TaxID=103775 RepID=A0A9Q0BJ76_9MUSC|nr:hypothetical protein M5D96_013372 [Drosophila gunungcola]
MGNVNGNVNGNGNGNGNYSSGGESEEPPPEPAPPEIPPRTQSLLMSLRKHSDYKLKYEEKGDQKHEEFIPTSQLQKGEFSRQAKFKYKRKGYFMFAILP